MKNIKILGIVLIALILFEIVFSGFMSYKDLKKKPNVCILGSSCDSVQNSSYGQIFGIKLPFIAIFAFILLLAVYFISPKLFLIGSSFGALGSAYLISIQFFVLKEICTNCMIIDAAMLLIFFLSILNFRYRK
jgi:uncharacterized membrane protein